MINMIVLCIIFPFALLADVRKIQRAKNVLLTKQDSNYLKGMASLMVVFAHYCLKLEEEHRLVFYIKPFRYLGPLGVAIFMFLSGYGLFASNHLEKINEKFLLKRIKNVYIPYIIVRIMFIMLKNYQFDSVWEAIGYLAGVIRPYWFIIVIMIIYIVYYFVSKINVDVDKKMGILVLGILFFSIIMYKIYGIEESYWYGNNLIFPLGVLAARFDKPIVDFLKTYWWRLFGVVVICLGLSCRYYFISDGILRIIGKFVLACFFITFLIMVMQKIDLRSKSIIFLGGYSLYIYITHSTIYTCMREYFVMNDESVTLIYFVLIVVIPIVLKSVIDFVFSYVERYLCKIRCSN